MKRSLVLVTLVLTACPKGGDKPKPVEPAGRGDAQQTNRLLPEDDGGAAALPPAPPLPTVPASLPPPPASARVTAEAVAFGELLFHDPRLSADGKRACASCHDPARGFAGGIEPAANGKPNARRAPTLFNLAWVKELGWDGRATQVSEYIATHMKGQLDAIEASASRIAAVPTYALHIARVGGTADAAIIQALEAYALTRYEGDTPWDSLERTARAAPGTAPNNPVLAGYQLFSGKAQCAVCHTPPLYTDNGYHKIVPDTVGDKGRGLVDPALTGAFKTPTLRGAMVRGAYFHNASKQTLDDVVAHYNTEKKLQLSADEIRQLVMFVGHLTTNRPRAEKPVLP